MYFGMIVDGRTDYPIIAAVVAAVFGDLATPSYLQPQRDQITGRFTHKVGWSNVKAWCEETAGIGGWNERLYDLDFLLVQLDADVLDQPQFNRISDLKSLCDTVKAWVDTGPPPRGVVITLPKRSTDTWLLAALSPQRRPDAEALPTRCVLEILEARGVLKNQYDYREHAPAIT